ncbi:quinone-dependent dihydroorotate dehydrogenase [Actinobacteria bacterium YIM 96077]|uniref:Dihydroorotate dehydrogenase (quinone) n=1 Tax=Phytoactinopolyspora halophila TaxID=1981511 RepID=A0A329QJA3_9ACTN|nr:quinone-dependent dihydroorotate dehydrogenase [Phytoactinopolyspora halophila]AYY13544.1 quinone-dependent dihydroorotate dehydrogenase [Actinobacteria bacterium YIM 96077]RAW12400.1 dihydroorotate dehydrogenase (quinone) [Phytoactinopolyspora halophila]
MSRRYRRLFDTVLSRLDAERVHRVAVGALRVVSRVPGVAPVAWRKTIRHDPDTGVEVFGLRFPGRLGLAAGFDKNAVGVDALAALGFAFVEVGTVTGRAQPGNPRPRLHRLMRDRAIVNRMGFNNDGAAVVAARLARRRRRRRALPVVVGVNIGKTKAVPEDEAVADYEASTRMLAPYADYLVVNVSSPNTPGLRDLQAVAQLRPLVTAVRAQADAVSSRRVPLLVKIAPDLSDDDVLAVADLAVEVGLDGIIATNTTISRDGLSSSPEEVDAAGAGGVSGAPLAKRSLEVLLLLSRHLDAVVDEASAADPDATRRPVLISAGGIETAEDAYERLRAGATLVQAYTAFVYGGPSWPSRVQHRLDSMIMNARRSM